MRLFKVTMFNKVTQSLEDSYIFSKTSKTAAEDVDCYRSHNYSIINSVPA